MWDFAYDGDGVRTATLVTPYDETGAPQSATLTSYYPLTGSGHRFGGAYEVTGTEVKKYYSFGGQTMMRDANGLQYFLSDHLGSVVAVTSDTGTLITQQRYLPFGAERTNIGVITQTDLGYTGQRDLGMGVMDYHARFYSPYLNRFIQPDTITPGGPQGLNRYSYVNNSPINFNDPSGHKACDGAGIDGTCDQSGIPGNLAQIKIALKSYGVKLAGKWNFNNGMKVLDAVESAADRFAQALDSEATEAFKDVFGITEDEQFEFEWVERTCEINGSTCWGYTPGARHIQIYETYNGIWDGNPYTAVTPVSTGLILHEMGHAFNQRLGGVPMAGLAGNLLRRPDREHGFFANHYVGQFSHDTSQSEIFADMFLGWAVGMWGDNGLGRSRRDYMTDMNTWALAASQIP